MKSQENTLREWGLEIGIFPTGTSNTLTDVPGVKVGHTTIIKGNNIRTGVTAILPHNGNLFQHKVPAAIYIGNGFGKLAGYSQVEELGNMESPIILTNTLSVSAGIQGGLEHTLGLEGNETVRSANIIVGETNDGYLNDIRGFHVKTSDVINSINNASESPVAQGNVGAGTGTIAFGYKGGIGSASRVLPSSIGGYTLGVLVQANFGGVLEVGGVPVAKELGRYPFKNDILNGDGSCIIVVMTNAPLRARNLKRLARRAMLGFGKTGGMSSNGSGDYVIAVSTAPEMRILYRSEQSFEEGSELRNNELSPLFQASIEATEEAILNALMAAKDMDGRNGHIAKRLNHDQLKKLLKQYGKIK